MCILNDFELYQILFHREAIHVLLRCEKNIEIIQNKMEDVFRKRKECMTRFMVITKYCFFFEEI